MWVRGAGALSTGVVIALVICVGWWCAGPAAGVAATAPSLTAPSQTAAGLTAGRACSGLLALPQACFGSPSSLPALPSAFLSAAGSAGANVALFNRETYTDSTDAADAARYQVIVLQYSDTVKSLVEQLHAQDPKLIVLVYSDAMWSSDPGAADGWTSCGLSSTVAPAPASWFLYEKGPNGQPQRIQSGAEYAMNQSNPQYQAACLAHAEALAKSADFNGVFWDQLDAIPVWGLRTSCVMPAGSDTCWTNPQWQQSEQSLLQAAQTAAHAGDLLSFANIGGAYDVNGNDYSGLWSEWGAYLDGAMEESFTAGESGSEISPRQWSEQLANASWSEAHAEYALLNRYDTTAQNQAGDVYGLASMLLVANGYSSYSSSDGRPGDNEIWFPEYTTATQLGAPVAPYTSVGGVDERRFAHGIVLVNPGSTTQTAPLGGRYSGSGDEPTNVDSVTLDPRSAMIMLAGG